MAVKPLWNSPPQWVDSSGNPYSSARLFFYDAGSSTKQNAYTDDTGNTAASNPTTLNSSGYPVTSGNIFAPWGTVGETYKLVLAPPGSDDPPNSTIWTADDISPINDTVVSLDQWVSGPTPTFIGATSFSLVGDQTSTFMAGRRLKTTNSGGTIYSTITTSVFGAVTTVTVVNDSGSLDSGLSAVSYGLLSNDNHSVPSFRAKGDILTQSAAGTLARLAVGSNGTVPMARSADTTGIAYVAALNKAIYGLTYANNAGDATNDLDIATGGAIDATGAYWMTLASALTKRSDANWAVGTNQGALDTGAVGNSDYYIWLIARSDTGVVDILFSLSATAPTMPAQYDFKRLMGWFKRTGGTIVAFDTYETEGGGLELIWDVPTLDVNLANTLTTARRTDAVKVPLDFSVIANLNVLINDASAGANAWIYCPDQADSAPSATVAPLANIGINNTTAYAISVQIQVRTSSAGLIAARATLATVDLYAVSTIGFKWARRN